MDQPPLGAGALQAFVRQGFKELGKALGTMTPESIQVDELGTIGNPTPQIVTQQMKEQDVDIAMDR